MMNFRKEYLSKLFIAFIFAGGLAATVNLLSGVFFRQYVSYSTSIFMAFPVGLLTAYLLNRLFIFGRGMHQPSKEIFYFVTINLFALILTYVVSYMLYRQIFPSINFTFYDAEISHALGIITPVFSSFLGHKYITFKGAHSNFEEQ